VTWCEGGAGEGAGRPRLPAPRPGADGDGDDEMAVVMSEVLIDFPAAHCGCAGAPGLPALWPCEARQRWEGARPDAVVAGGPTADPGLMGVAQGGAGLPDGFDPRKVRSSLWSGDCPVF